MTEHCKMDISPFVLPGGPVGALMIHGYTSTPPAMRPIGEYLNLQGITISVPLLPGHGTKPEDMNRCAWMDWANHVEQALETLQAQCETVFVGGQSMGALLALYLGITHSELGGVFTYSPALRLASNLIQITPILKYIMPMKAKHDPNSDLTDPTAKDRLCHYAFEPVAAAHQMLKLSRWVDRRLPEIKSPLLVVYSTLDPTIHPQSGPRVHERSGSADKAMMVLHNSGHCLSVDSEWQDVAERTHRFVIEHVGSSA